MPLSRKTNRAKAMATKRRCESPETVENKLSQKRNFMKCYRQSQSLEARGESQTKRKSLTRETRLASMREYTNFIRNFESPCERQSRLTQMSQHAQVIRSLETPSEREARLRVMKQNANIDRSLETSSEREARLAEMRQHASEVRGLETPPEREARVVQMRQHASEVRTLESPSTRDNRLENMRERTSQIYQTRRDMFLTENDSFRAEISQIADQVCYVCKTYKFKNQVKKLKKNILILPEDFPDEVIACNRCATAINKNKVPSTAYWNNLSVPEIPPEIQNLSEMELRLISRIVPFIKIVRLGGRFSQKGFKGQAILFAQEVEEVAEQLPLTIAQCGLTIVVERLQNVNTHKEYLVDTNKIKSALQWLIRNNMLYENVRINFDALENLSDENVIEMSIREAEIVPEPATHFKPVAGSDAHILRASFHQGSDIFPLESRNKQCTANAAAAIAHAYSKPVRFWQPSDIDRVLMSGDKFYKKCIDSLPHKPDYLATDELHTNIEIAETSYTLQYEIDCIVGLIRPTNPSSVPEPFYTNLADALNNFLESHDSCIITSQTIISVAIIKQGSDLFLIDSHSRGPKGHIAQSGGRAMVMSFSTVDNLARHLPVVLAARTGRNIQFSLTSVTTTNPNNNPTITGNSLEHEVSTQNYEQRNVKLLNNDIDDPTAPLKTTMPNNENNDPTIIVTSLVQEVSTQNFEQSNVTELNHDIYDPATINVDNENDQINITALMPIDIQIPDVTEVVDVTPTTSGIEERCRTVNEIRRKTIPPVSVLKERRAEELAFVKLFPTGRGGLNEDRPVKITALDYFSTRIMNSDTRFQNVEYLFYALSTVELLRAKQNVSVCGRLRQDGAHPSDLIQNLHLCMRNIRGTSSYWRRAFTDLLAMVKNLGPPHWYITFSCNDLNWPDILKALLVADGKPDVSPHDLSFQERVRLVESYPVTLSRQFMFRFNAIMRVLKGNSSILNRELEDFWWRVEYQLRGSPHIHMIIWCRNMPDFNSPEGIAVLEQVVSCRSPQDDPRLKELVTRVQTHHHTSTCYKKNNTTSCRFNFPQPASENTVILDDQQAIANGGKFFRLKRTNNETMINNYNDQLLKLWRANIDIQPIVSAIGVAYYIAKYISKSESVDIQSAIGEAIRKVRERGGNFGNQIFAVQNALLNHRQVSAAEAAQRLCHMKLRDSSRRVVFLNTCEPHLRYRMLRWDSECPELCKNIFERYENRPLNLESLSLGEFAVTYEPLKSLAFVDDDEDGDEDAYNLEPAPSAAIITLMNRMGKMKKRNRAAVLRTRYFTALADPQAYYYSLLVTHCPFRCEEELLTGHDSAKNAFMAKKHHLRPLQPGYDTEQVMNWENEIQDALRRIVAENAATACAENTNNAVLDDFGINFLPQPDANDDDRLIDLEIELEEYPNNMAEAGFSDEDYERGVRSLNLEQKELFTKISQHLLNPDPDNSSPLLMFVTGGAGSGKSFTLKLIVEQIKRLSTNKQCVAITAPTGVAARLVGGCTLHSTFSLPIEKGRPAPLRPLTGDRLQRERQKWRNIHWLIIDEISMVPYATLRNIHLRLQELKQNNTIFGGVNVLSFGDLMQLPPVTKTSGGSYCFQQPEINQAEPHLWQIFSFCELKHNMRQADDTTFIDILNNVRVGKLTIEQLAILDSRRVSDTDDHAETVHVFPTVRKVDDYNYKMTEYLGKTSKLYSVQAVDTSTDPKTYGQTPKPECIPHDPNRTGGIVEKLVIGIGSRVMLRKNLNVQRGLVNGAMGVIKCIEWPALRRDQLEVGELPNAVMIKFDDPTICRDPSNLVRIEPTNTEFDGLRGAGKITRTMLPLILSWGVTIHKLQGCTLEKAVIDIGKNIFAKGQVYVALSRVKTLDGLFISELEPMKLLKNPHDKKSLDELERLRNLPN